MSAGGTARTVVLSSAGTYDKQTGVKYKWSNMVHRTEIKDVAMAHPQATRFIGNTKGKAKGKGGAKGKKSKKGKPTDYDKDLFSSSKDEDNFDPEEGVGAAIALPNVLPLPGFLVVALIDAYTIDAYTTDAGILCLATIEAIRKRAIGAGVDPADSTAAQKAAYVPIWIWNHATERVRVPTGRAKGVGTSISVSQRADLWASGVHKRYLHTTSSGSAAQTSPSIQRTEFRGVDAVGADVWTNLAIALATQAALWCPTTTGARKGFEAFPITTQEMILFASERDETGWARSAPVDTYTEILGLSNTAYVAQHLHHHLKMRLGLDMLLPSGVCSAVTMASFISTTNYQPEAFSLFSSGSQPLDKKASTGLADDVESANDLMRTQLKVADLTTGLSDKDIKEPTLVPHVVPCNFRDLAKLFANMAGVTEFIFGTVAPVTMLVLWVHFLTRTGGATVANLRQLAFQDVTAPSRLRWFVERRIQQYSTLCASCGHIDAVNVKTLDFQAEQQHLDDGLFPDPLCPYLKTKPGLADASVTPRSGFGGGHGRSGSAYPINAVTNPSGRLFKITSRDVLQVPLITLEMRPCPTSAAAII